MRYYSINLNYTKRETDPFVMLHDFQEYVLDLQAAYDEFNFDPYEVIQSDRNCCLSTRLGFEDEGKLLITANFAMFWRKGDVDMHDCGTGI